MKTTRFKDPATKRWKYRADFTCAGVRHRPVADTSEELKDEIDAIRRRARQRRYGLPVERESVTLARLVARRAADYPAGHRARPVLEDFAARFAGLAVEELSEVELGDYVRALREEFRSRELDRRARARRGGRDYEPREVSSETINKALGFVSGMLRAAPRLFRELAGYRPPRVPWEKVSRRKRRRPLTEEEDARLLAALRSPRQTRRLPTGRLFTERPVDVEARREVADIFEINLNTGMRGGETVALTWPQVDFLNGEIYLGKTKNGEDRFVPMNSTVASIMRRRYEARRSAFVFPNPAGSAPRFNYRKTFARVARDAGLPYGQRLDYGFTMHATRHTAGTRMQRRGADLATVQAILGHSDQTMTLVYSHASSRTKKEAVESLVRAGPAKKEEEEPAAAGK